jgi:hypothetical protein
MERSPDYKDNESRNGKKCSHSMGYGVRDFFIEAIWFWKFMHGQSFACVLPV